MNPSDSPTAHYTFVVELARELISGKWAEAPSEDRILYSGDLASSQVDESVSLVSAIYGSGRNRNDEMESPKKTCSGLSSKQMFGKSSQNINDALSADGKDVLPHRPLFSVSFTTCACATLSSHRRRPPSFTHTTPGLAGISITDTIFHVVCSLIRATSSGHLLYMLKFAPGIAQTEENYGVWI